MTHDERQTVVRAGWEALFALIPARSRPLALLQIEALRLLYVDDAAAQFAAGLKQGLLSVEAREDRRDLCDVQDAPELRSVH